MNFDALAASRYSCRKLSDKPVSEELMDKIVETAILAPTAVNYQPYRIFRMKSAGAKEAVHAVTRCTFGAPEFLVVGYREAGAWVREFDGRNFADVDASIVATHIMMEIKELGLDTTWVGHFDAPKLKTLCPQLKDYALIAIFPVGYAAEDAEPAPRHTQRKPKQALFEEI